MRQIVQWLNIKIPYRQLKPEKEEELMTQLIDSNLRKKLTNSMISKLHFNTCRINTLFKAYLRQIVLILGRVKNRVYIAWLTR